MIRSWIRTIERLDTAGRLHLRPCPGFSVTPPGEDVHMETRQLVLIDDDRSDRNDWKLDERTRQVGLDGIAAARRALREALARGNEDTQSTAA